ncbi:37S ribosomal protein S26, mitochondrial [[Candida] jaroonii]|uniref:37S ribosomal protein S26, mitochondrial n=1 Tax=[Candida] jaroonii TaxID=467808 RepID=A0ACA9XZV5_9ASCO|nr:37S ribosomal protein S26, mitochondrial [[Candida] jaroonii]
MFKRTGLRITKRLIHDVPKLKGQYKYETSGIEGLYSPEGFKGAWTDYQKFLTMNLTLLTNGTENEFKSPYQILLNTAKQTTEQHIFHYASQAHNNHFVFQQLTNKSEASKTQPSRNLMGRINDMGFKNLQELYDQIVKLSETMNGQGWIFLVENPDKSLKLIQCNNDGTPYFYGKNQSLDLNGGISEQTYEKYLELKNQVEENSRDFTLPILGINLWDHAYINDYGINGREEYLKNLWSSLNWDVINGRLFEL